MIEPLVKTDCPDCGVDPDMQHQEGCDIARCVLCGAQALGCHYQADEDSDDNPLLCENTGEPIPAETMQTWTGIWPGVEECREFGWYARWTKTLPGFDEPNTGPMVACEADHPHAREDLNRLALAGATGELRWDRDRQRWVKP